jgi:Rod binding domain-containing protein
MEPFIQIDPSTLVDLKSPQFSGLTPKEAQLKAVSQEFESIFLYFLLSAMRRSTLTPEEGLFGPKSTAEEIFTEMLDEQYAKEIAQAGGIGIGEMLFKQLRESAAFQEDTGENPADSDGVKREPAPQTYAEVSKPEVYLVVFRSGEMRDEIVPVDREEVDRIPIPELTQYSQEETSLRMLAQIRMFVMRTTGDLDRIRPFIDVVGVNVMEDNSDSGGRISLDRVIALIVRKTSEGMRSEVEDETLKIALPDNRGMIDRILNQVLTQRAQEGKSQQIQEHGAYVVGEITETEGIPEEMPSKAPVEVPGERMHLARDVDGDHRQSSKSIEGGVSLLPTSYVDGDKSDINLPSHVEARIALRSSDGTEFIDQIVRKVALSVSEGRSEMRLHLDPPDLGRLFVRLVVQDNVLTAHIRAQSEAVANTLRANLPQLQTALSDRGINVADLSVSVGYGWGGDDQRYDRTRMLIRREVRRRIESPSPPQERVSLAVNLSKIIDYFV